MLGQSFSVMKAPRWANIVHTGTSGKEVRVAMQSTPLWDFTLTFGLLSQLQKYPNVGSVPVPTAEIDIVNLVSDDFKALGGFFLGRQGSYDSFLFDDPTDNWIAQQQIGVGDGASVNFQITRQFGEYAETAQNINGTSVGTISTWQASTAVASNGLIIPTLTAIKTQAGRVMYYQSAGWPNYFKATTPGTTSATEPNWRNAPVSGATLTDGGVTWTNQGNPLIVYVTQTPPNWITAIAYALGAVIVPTANNAGGFTYQCTTAGTSGGSAPSFSQSLGGTTADGAGALVWTNIGVTGTLIPQLPSKYTINSTGRITFGTAPPATGSPPIQITTGFYYRCRFKQDTTDFEEFMNRLWGAKKLMFTSVKL